MINISQLFRRRQTRPVGEVVAAVTAQPSGRNQDVAGWTRTQQDVLDEMRHYLRSVRAAGVRTGGLHEVAQAMLRWGMEYQYRTAFERVEEIRRVLTALDRLLAEERAEHTDQVVVALRAG